MKLINTTDDKINKHILLEILACALIVLTTLLNTPLLVSLFFAATFFIVLRHVFSLMYYKGVSRMGIFALLIVVTSLLMVCVNSMLNNARINFEYAKPLIVFMSTIFFLYAATNTPINKNTAEFILKAYLIVSLLYPFAYFFFSYETTDAGLLMNFTNQNLLALWLALSVLYCTLCVIGLRKVWRVLGAMSAGFNIYLIFLTRCRNVLFALLLFLILLIIVMLKKKGTFSNTFLWILNLLPLLFIPIYLHMVDPMTEAGYLDFIIDEGKPLGSRAIIWNLGFKYLKGYWLTGRYSVTNMHGNMHNSMMVLLCSYGILVTIAVIIYMYIILKSANDKATSKFQSYSLICFFAVLFMGIGEGFLFSGGVGIYIPACGYLMLANSEFSTAAITVKKKQTSKYIKGWRGSR